MRAGRGMFLAAAAILIVACSGGATPDASPVVPGSTVARDTSTAVKPITGVATPTTTLPKVTTSSQLDMGDVPDFEVTTVTVGEERWTVAVADDDAERVQGLQEVADLGDLDGMLFVFDDARQVTFTMRNTLIPLDLGLFDESGSLVQVIEMVPCEADRTDCPPYPSTSVVRWALESRAGRLVELPLGTRLLVG